MKNFVILFFLSKGFIENYYSIVKSSRSTSIKIKPSKNVEKIHSKAMNNLRKMKNKVDKRLKKILIKKKVK